MAAVATVFRSDDPPWTVVSVFSLCVNIVTVWNWDMLDSSTAKTLAIGQSVFIHVYYLWTDVKDKLWLPDMPFSNPINFVISNVVMFVISRAVTVISCDIKSFVSQSLLFSWWDYFCQCGRFSWTMEPWNARSVDVIAKYYISGGGNESIHVA